MLAGLTRPGSAAGSPLQHVEAIGRWDGVEVGRIKIKTNQGQISKEEETHGRRRKGNGQESLHHRNW
jgi:hypothetical protein